MTALCGACLAECVLGAALLAGCSQRECEPVDGYRVDAGASCLERQVIPVRWCRDADEQEERFGVVALCLASPQRDIFFVGHPAGSQLLYPEGWSDSDSFSDDELEACDLARAQLFANAPWCDVPENAGD